MARRDKDPLLEELRGGKAETNANAEMAPSPEIDMMGDGSHQHPELEARIAALERQVDLLAPKRKAKPAPEKEAAAAE